MTLAISTSSMIEVYALYECLTHLRCLLDKSHSMVEILRIIYYGRLIGVYAVWSRQYNHPCGVRKKSKYNFVRICRDISCTQC